MRNKNLENMFTNMETILNNSKNDVQEQHVVKFYFKMHMSRWEWWSEENDHLT